MISTFLLRHFRKQGKGISLVIPFQSTESTRIANFEWLMKYWKEQLPKAQIIVGKDIASLEDPTIPFSKSAAVNDGVMQAKGDIIAIIDADGYVSAESVLYSAKKIREARERGQRLWFVPYRSFIRLTPEASKLVLQSSPRRPFTFTQPPAKELVQMTSAAQMGHWYGAMVQIIPAEAFTLVGGWDERFRGWGGEDRAAMLAMDTLYWPHKTTSNQVLHLWHNMLSMDVESIWLEWKERMWPNQKIGVPNSKLSQRYHGAQKDPIVMRILVEEWKNDPDIRGYHHRHHHHHRYHHHHHHPQPSV